MQWAAGARGLEVDERAAHGAVTDWERHNADALIELSCTVPGDRPFRAREVNLQVDRVDLAHVSGSPHEVRRDCPMVDSRPVSALVAYASLGGDASVELGARKRSLRPGQVLLVNADQPFTRTFGDGFQEIAVKAPMPVLEGLAGLAVPAEPVVLDAGGAGADPYARALVRLTRRSLTGQSLLPAEETTLLELMAAAVAGVAARSAVTHRIAARSYIARHLTDPRLSAAEVATGIGISERQLTRIFGETGLSVPQYILGRRLDLAHARLLGPDRQRRTADVATDCGFGSVAHFSRAFSQRFGVAAGQVRRSAGSAA